MKDQFTGEPIKAKTMTDAQALQVLEKVASEVHGKKRRRALAIAMEKFVPARARAAKA